MIILIQFLIFLSYVTFIYLRYGILTSISTSWYLLPKKQKILFVLFCFSIGMLMIFHGGIFFFLSGTGLLFTGAAAEYESKGAYTNIVHFVGAVISVIFAILGLWLDYNIYFPLLVIPISLFIYLMKIKNYLWWMEIISFLFIMMGLFLK